MFADFANPDFAMAAALTASIGAVVSMVGIVAWILKSAIPSIATQYRTDVFAMQTQHNGELKEARARFEAIIQDTVIRFDKIIDRELAKRDAVLADIVASVKELTEEVRALKEKR